MEPDKTNRYFTVVFRGDIRTLPFNPMKAETIFGHVCACSVGDIISDKEAAIEAVEDIRTILDKLDRAEPEQSA